MSIFVFEIDFLKRLIIFGCIWCEVKICWLKNLLVWLVCESVMGMVRRSVDAIALDCYCEYVFMGVLVIDATFLYVAYFCLKLLACSCIWWCWWGY